MSSDTGRDFARNPLFQDFGNPGSVVLLHNFLNVDISHVQSSKAKEQPEGHVARRAAHRLACHVAAPPLRHPGASTI